jgi:hypothetical protein
MNLRLVVHSPFRQLAVKLYLISENGHNHGLRIASCQAGAVFASSSPQRQ